MTLYQKIIYRIYFKIRAFLRLKEALSRYVKHRDTLFLIYSAGKTGSSTVYYTLMKELPFNKVLHAHFLSDYWIQERIPTSKTIKNKTRNQMLAKKVYKALKKKPQVKVITLIRDPFSRGISAYFHSKANRKAVRDKSLEQIRKEIATYSKDTSLYWFDTDFNSFFNSNVFEYPFNKDEGYQELTLSEKFDILLIRTDILNKNGKGVIESFLGIDISYLFTANTRDSTPIGRKYKEVKEYYYEKPEDFREKINAQIINHFFSESQATLFESEYLRANRKA